MEKCIDIYSKLLIATITFTVPVIINLLSSFTAGEKRRKELSKVAEDDINIQTAQEIQENPEKIRETIAKTHQQYEMNDKKTKTEIDLLNPIIQFWNIFICLSICFVLLLLSYLTDDEKLFLYNHTYSIILLTISFVSYFVALFYIIRILYTISKTKKIVEV